MTQPSRGTIVPATGIGFPHASHGLGCADFCFDDVVDPVGAEAKLRASIPFNAEKAQHLTTKLRHPSSHRATGRHDAPVTYLATWHVKQRSTT